MAITAGGSLNSVPASQRQTLSSNYIDFTASGTSGWAQQYLPDLMEKEAEVFGNRTIAGFLSQVGAEEAMTSDQVIWSEQGRLHLSYKGTVNTGTGALSITTDIDDVALTTTHGIRRNDIVIVATAEGAIKCLVTDGFVSTADIVTVKPYEVENIDDSSTFATATAAACTVLVIGSEWAKGVNGQGSAASDEAKAVKPTHTSFTNKPIIMKDYYEISGSDASQIGWVEITGEDGQNGFLWYLKAEGDTRSRFSDYLEMTMMEAVKGFDVANDGVED